MIEEKLEPYLNNIALVLMLIIVFAGVYLIIYIHDIPYEIAKKRHHPHKEAIHAAGWVSLFLAHALWPILWIWAFLYKSEEDHPGAIVVPAPKNKIKDDSATKKLESENKLLQNEIETLKKELELLKSKQSPNT